MKCILFPSKYAYKHDISVPTTWNLSMDFQVQNSSLIESELLGPPQTYTIFMP